MKIKNTELVIVQGDITKIKADAIVNSANTSLLMHKGLAAAIKKAGGQSIEDEARKQAPAQKGEAIKTSAGRLALSAVIHAVINTDNDPADETSLRNAIRNSLSLAKENKMHSIAFPALGTVSGGFSAKAAAKIMAQEAHKHAFYDQAPLKQIYFVLFDEATFSLFNQQVSSYLTHLQEKICQGPFVTVDIIIELEAGGIVLIERSNPPFGWALPGGFLDYGETLEECAAREAKEETNLDIYDLEQMHTYSDPRRDPRFQTVTTVFVAKAKGIPRAGDDAQNQQVVFVDNLPALQFAFDHEAVLQDYKKFKVLKEKARRG